MIRFSLVLMFVTTGRTVLFVMGGVDNCQDMTFLTEPVNVASPGVTYHETPDVLVGSGL